MRLGEILLLGDPLLFDSESDTMTDLIGDFAYWRALLRFRLGLGLELLSSPFWPFRLCFWSA